MDLRNLVLSHKFLYEIFFIITRKKISRKRIDNKLKNGLFHEFAHSKTEGLIVSLTSYGERLLDLKYCLYSLVCQTIQPERIIVWLAEGESIPEELSIFMKYGVEFKFCKDLKSYKKLIPTIKLYPNKSIVTADDDIYYEPKWLEKIWASHIKYPDCKIAHTAHRLCFDERKHLLNYNKWKQTVTATSPSKAYFPTGCGGCLYPPGTFSDIFINEKLFMSLCPNADDIWFYFMGLLIDQNTLIVSKPYRKLRYVDIYKEYGLNGKSTLQSINVEQNQNDIQIKNVMKYFDLVDEKLFYKINS